MQKAQEAFLLWVELEAVDAFLVCPFILRSCNSVRSMYDIEMKCSHIRSDLECSMWLCCPVLCHDRCLV